MAKKNPNTVFNLQHCCSCTWQKNKVGIIPHVLSDIVPQVCDYFSSLMWLFCVPLLFSLSSQFRSHLSKVTLIQKASLCVSELLNLPEK